jgi:hypothetical protein
VEDWGCGLMMFRNFCRGEYVGIDGSESGANPVIHDLAEYRSDTPGLHMRHVLEHDYRWADILDNALNSFTERMTLILFTPIKDETQDVGYTYEIDVPDIAFKESDIVKRFDTVPGISWTKEHLRTGTWYGEETLYYLEKS